MKQLRDFVKEDGGDGWSVAAGLAGAAAGAAAASYRPVYQPVVIIR
jgi:hypothetical protein